jgi:hypothetical protein
MSFLPVFTFLFHRMRDSLANIRLFSDEEDDSDAIEEVSK